MIMIGIVYYAMVVLSIPIAIVLLVLYVRRKEDIQLVAALLWLIPPVYECLVLSTCSGECNIRIDLVLVFPVELLVLIPLTTRVWRAYKTDTTD